MADIKLFTKDDCTKCDYVRERLPENIVIEILNVDTVDGLAEGAYYGILDKGFPVLVLNEEYVAEGSINILDKIKEISSSK